MLELDGGHVAQSPIAGDATAPATLKSGMLYPLQSLMMGRMYSTRSAVVQIS